MSPLAGVRIADFTIHAAGPFCTHMLSQLGAECIKIESRSRPDAFRKPHAVYGRMEPATFDQVSANKLSIRLNLKTPDGVELAKRLVALSDVAAESFRPGVMQRLGLGADTLHRIKPDLVLLSLSSCGQYGPDSHFAGYAPLFGAWGGLGAMSGYPDGPPVEMRHVMDHTSGLHAALAVTAALHQRRRTGQGQHIDLAAREVACAMAGDALVMASLGRTPERLGNGHARMAPHGVYPTGRPDRWLTLAVDSDAAWQALLGVLDRASAYAGDARFATEERRRANRVALDALVAEWLAGADADRTAAALQAAGVAAHVSWTAQDIADDPHLRERGAIVQAPATGGAPRAAVGLPVRFSKADGTGLRRGTPELGQDEDYVYGELLGLSRAQRDELEGRQVIY
jgi:crotonobetainyl-CoA:carnitine CoA-transferase CaiB-like acyl-CoA transferase